VELSRITALDEEGVRIVTIGQENAASGDALRPQTMCELLRGLLAAVVGVDIEGEINGARTIAQLLKLVSVEMRAQRTGGMAKTCVPQHREIEQTFDQNHCGKLANRFPGEQAALGAGEESMGEGGSDTAAIEVDDASTLAAREDNASVEGIVTLRIEQAEAPQELARIALSREMTAQAPTRGITDPQFFDQGRIAQSSLLKIARCLGVAIELLLIESGGLLKHGDRVGCESALLVEVSEAFAEGQMTGQLDKANEIAALTATVTVKEIFAGVDIERRPGFRMQGTESDELGAVSGGPVGPILLPQIIEQRKTLFQFFDVLAHGAVLPLEANVGEGSEHFQARMVGGEIFSETQGPENLQNRSQPRQRPSLVIDGIAVCQPVSHAGERLAEKGKCRLGTVQAVAPAAKCGRIGYTVRVFERRRGLFPGAVFHKAPPQCLTARQQTVVRVRERKQREEGEGPLATGAATTTNANPVVVFIVRLLAAASVADDRIDFTSGASPQNNLGAAGGPICFEVVRQDEKWDKQNRTSLELCHGVDLPRSEPEAELLPPDGKAQLKENNPSRLQLLRV
jgi:hypothetical protein